jgi:hypothetical protein
MFKVGISIYFCLVLCFCTVLIVGHRRLGVHVRRRGADGGGGEIRQAWEHVLRVWNDAKEWLGGRRIFLRCQQNKRVGVWGGVCVLCGAIGIERGESRGCGGGGTIPVVLQYLWVLLLGSRAMCC